MVSTRQAGKTRKSAAAAPSPADSGDEYEERTPESSKTGGIKRVRASKTTAKGNQQGKRRKIAKLSMLPDMPIDILYEIFSLVHPKDLMGISWTSKTLNSFLTSKSSRHVWQVSFETIPESEKPPPRPSGITEMAYANLLYGQCCMSCGNANPPISAWRALLRICGFCVEEIAIDLRESRPDELEYGSMYEILPAFRVKYTHGGVVAKALRSDSKRFSEELAAAGKSSRKNVVEKWKSVVRERDEFLNAMLELERLAREAKEDARADIQKRRIEQIWEKLCEEGWREEIATHKSEYEPGLMKIKGVTMIRPLGKKAWAELRDPLNEFMREQSGRIRAELDKAQRQFRIAKIARIVDSFRFSLPHPHDFYPSEADICWIPEVQKAIIDGTDQEFQDCEADIRVRISELSAAWLEERKQAFLKLLPRDSRSLERLSLAVTLFDCTKCRKSGMRVEEALSHACYYYRDGRTLTGFSNVNSAQMFCYDAGEPWDSKVAEYKYSAHLATIVREIVLECGEDPDAITTKEMNRKHYRFARFGSDGAITVLSWQQAFEHKRKCGNTVPCRILRPDELPEYVPDPENARGSWGCLRCWGTGEPKWHDKYFKAITDHLAQSHQIKNPTEEDYYCDKPVRDTPFKYRPGGNV